MNRFRIRSDWSYTKRNKLYEYSIDNLRSICCHSGSVNEGHYYAMVDGRLIDDERVIELKGMRISNEGYLLFYY